MLPPSRPDRALASAARSARLTPPPPPPLALPCNRWRNSYDPSCPGKRRSCNNVPFKYYSACCAGKRAEGVYDWACDRSNRPGWSCGSRRDVDGCCAARNPWKDSSCYAWTRGSCSKVASKWQSTCCAQKWRGQDSFCDSQRYGSSCASWGPAVDACCASVNPWSDSACKAWLPSGSCAKVGPAYKDACCSNKRPGTQGCPLPPPPPAGATCASRGPKYADTCCSELSDPSVDSSCDAWTPAGTCADVRGKDLQTACW